MSVRTAQREESERLSRSQRWTVLLVQAQEGEESAFARLVTEAREPVWRYVYQLVGDDWLAEEVVSGTFTKLWRTLKRYDANKSNARTWIYRIARHQAKDHYEKQARRREKEVSGFEILFPGSNDEDTGSLEPVDPHGVEPGEECDRPRLAKMLEEGLAKLRRKDRDLLGWFHHDGLNYAQIARRLGCTLQAVGPRLTRARAHLRKVLPPEAGE
jgi:RNA polymerase sigma-70 factor (ECF subfamily)